MPRTEYEEVLSSLYALEAAKGMDFKLERVALALKNLGDPHRQFRAVHIAGTNGKGSVAAMVHSITAAAGYRVGLYTSPHLVSFTERIRIGATEIDEATVVELTREIRTAATVCGIELTFFEFVTVMAFLYFARRHVDLAVIEVGLGGRLDATNVLDPEVSVITTIGLDHQEFLGSSLESIAGEKAGIIKPGRPVVIGKVPAEVHAVFARMARDRRAPVCWAGDECITDDATPFRFAGLGCTLSELTVGLRGAHQRDNAATAIATVLHLRKKLRIDDDAIRRGLAGVRWPGRLEIVQAAPLVILDGAHNVDGVATLVRELPSVVGHRRIHLLFGVMRDKDWRPMVEMLGPRVRSATVTTVLPIRGEEENALAAAFARYCPVRTVPRAHDGLVDLLAATAYADAILITGSLFLVGQIYPYFLQRNGRQSVFGADAAALSA